MEEMLQSQIQNSCKLALPNGLQELMSDISREVLRAQPSNLIKFITDYLSTLLVTRENLFIAARVCGAVCDCSCRPELDEEFKHIGLDDEEAANAADIIEEFFGKGKVNEGNLLIKLVKKTSINESQLPELLAAIRRAFIAHQKNHTQIFEASSNSDTDETTNAVRHTLGLFRKTDPSEETYDSMARKIQTAYRAYRVKRHRESLKSNKTDQRAPASRTNNLEKSKVTFGTYDKAEENVRSTDQHSDTSDSDDSESAKAEADQSQAWPCLNKISSTSLAGSYLCLPKYKPYSAHDIGKLMYLEELPEKERSIFDYTRETLLADKGILNKDMTKENRRSLNRNILFYETAMEDRGADEVNDESESVISEDIVEECVTKQYLFEKDKNRAEIIAKEDILAEDIIEGNLEEDIAEEVIEKDYEDIAEDIVEDGFMEEGIDKDGFEDINVTGSY